MKKILIDLEKCFKCRKCTAECNYYYHPENNGTIALQIRAIREFICRKCEDAPCIIACPAEALEKNGNGVLRKNAARCTGCTTCTLACPFGTLYPELVGYFTEVCDSCLDRLNLGEPLCVRTCPEKAIQFIEVVEDKGKSIFKVNENLYAHCLKWAIEKI